MIEVVGRSVVGSTAINGDTFYISENKNFFLLADGASGAGEEGKVLMGKICREIAQKYEPFISFHRGLACLCFF